MFLKLETASKTNTGAASSWVLFLKRSQFSNLCDFVVPTFFLKETQSSNLWVLLCRGTRLTHDKAGGAIQQMVSVIFLLNFTVSLPFLINLKGLTWFFSLTMKGLAWAVQGRSPKWSVLDCSQRWWLDGGKVSSPKTYLSAFPFWSWYYCICSA